MCVDCPRKKMLQIDWLILFFCLDPYFKFSFFHLAQPSWPLWLLYPSYITWLPSAKYDWLLIWKGEHLFCSISTMINKRGKCKPCFKEYLKKGPHDQSDNSMAHKIIKNSIQSTQFIYYFFYALLSKTLRLLRFWYFNFEVN